MASTRRTRIYGTGLMFAKSQISKAMREGRLAHPRSLLCADCGGPATGYDHRDYNYPLCVDPICTSCNARRGPAIPRKGFFAEMFATGLGVYTKRVNMGLIFELVGIKADLSHFPRNVTYEHWLLFRDQLLAWENGSDINDTPFSAKHS